MSQNVVLCEGFDDRAFWNGWLQHLGCRPAETATERRDEWGREVSKGRYLFYSPAGDRILVEPYGGRSNLNRAVDAWMRDLATRPIRRLVLNIDSDVDVEGAGPAAVGREPASLRDLIGRTNPNGVDLLPVVWECADPNAPGIPRQQTLERLVSAAIAAAYPGRGESVARWLVDPPAGDTESPKGHSLSYAAKWYASHGTEDFYAHVWRVPEVAAELQARLRVSGAWATVETLIAP